MEKAVLLVSVIIIIRILLNDFLEKFLYHLLSSSSCLGCAWEKMEFLKSVLIIIPL